MVTEFVFYLLLKKRFPEINLQPEKYPSSALPPFTTYNLHKNNAPNNSPIYKRNTHSSLIFFKSKLNCLPQLSNLHFVFAHTNIFCSTSNLQAPLQHLQFSSSSPASIFTVAPSMPTPFVFIKDIRVYSHVLKACRKQLWGAGSNFQLSGCVCRFPCSVLCLRYSILLSKVIHNCSLSLISSLHFSIPNAYYIMQI